MEFLLVIIGGCISYIILYYVIKAAVRDGIVEARDEKSFNDGASKRYHIDRTIRGGTGIAQTICQNCKRNYDIDYPKCPYCKSDNIQ